MSFMEDNIALIIIVYYLTLWVSAVWHKLKYLYTCHHFIEYLIWSLHEMLYKHA